MTHLAPRLLAAMCLSALTACGSTVSVHSSTPAQNASLGPGRGGATTDVSDPTTGDAFGPDTASGQGAPPGTTPLRPAFTAPTTPDSAPASGSSLDPALPSSGANARGPLRIGLLSIKAAGAAVGAIGGNYNSSASEGDWAQATLSYLNKHGGIAGRKVEAVRYEIDPQSSNYDSDLAAACAKFTQDNHVPVVMSQMGLLWSASYNACLTKAGVVNIVSAGAMGDRGALKRFPNLYNTTGPGPERRTRALLTGLHNSGYLTSKNVLGVVVEDCPESTATYSTTLLPVAKQLGLTVKMRTVDCLRGFSDAGGFAGQIGAAILPFRTEKVDRVMFLTAWEALSTLFFENQARSQGYAPSYALTSNGGVNALADNFGPDALARMRGIGWAPTYDTTAGASSPGNAECHAVAKQANFQITSTTDRTNMLTVCEHFRRLKVAVEAASGRTDAASISAGLKASSATYQSVLQLGGQSLLGNGRQDAPAQVAEFAYRSNCSCFAYIGRPQPLG